MRPEGLLEGEGDVTEGYDLLGVGLAAPEGEEGRGSKERRAFRKADRAKLSSPAALTQHRGGVF